MPKVTCVDLEGNEYKVDADRLRFRPATYAVVIKDGKLLVSKQYDGFDLPGGGVDLHETLEQAVVREAKEETGINVKNPQLIQVAESFFKIPGREEFVHSILFYYVCEHVGGELSIDGFDEWEKQYGDMPEWLPLEKLSGIKVVSTHDWRVVVQKAQAL